MQYFSTAPTMDYLGLERGTWQHVLLQLDMHDLSYVSCLIFLLNLSLHLIVYKPF